MDYSVIKKIILVVQSITVLLFVLFSFPVSLLAKEDTTPSGIPISDLEGIVDIMRTTISEKQHQEQLLSF